MHTEVRRTKNVEIKVTNVENGTEECGIIGFVSHEGVFVCGCMDKVARGPLGHRSEGHPGWGRTHVTGSGHRGRTRTEVKHASFYDAVIPALFELIWLNCPSQFPTPQMASFVQITVPNHITHYIYNHINRAADSHIWSCGRIKCFAFWLDEC